ncbi:uncharacterized protein LY89DRAFT_729519 [Mollisia scopiformis]|uniref:Cell cycle control protein n=1 Tax=Mollisia scopiformis TaxID=149040 RepID=A0A194XQP0_MOLSC|nr:uncharacterized protein LY89DRAFT_729519 [Mollisia scopiformis]KUJ22037.1 hypothetical protein LY89DRAFT_729519 [Mollisia scopiformis]
MSQATLSPSPIFGDSPASNFFGRAGPSAPSNDFPSLFRRRTSHPHNNHNHSQRSSVEMAEASQSQRPRLEHRQSQTIIDLTDDVEEAPVPSPRNASRNRASRPPHLGRSDASRLQDMSDLIDLTEDSSDVVILRESAVERPQRPQPVRREPPHRNHSPPLFVPNRPQHGHLGGVVASPHAIGYITGAVNHIGNLGGAVMPGALRDFLGIHMHYHDHFGNQQAMPGVMNYQNAAFAERKPDHVAPSPVPAGFTRSPKDEDIVICPSCEEELVHRKEDEEPPVKKGGRAPTRKDREEHPFWVIKECGHVYCNKCYQLRQQASKHDSVQFREVEKSTGKKAKILTCNIEDCHSDVKSKEKWVGVFL